MLTLLQGKGGAGGPVTSLNDGNAAFCVGWTSCICISLVHVLVLFSLLHAGVEVSEPSKKSARSNSRSATAIECAGGPVIDMKCAR